MDPLFSASIRPMRVWIRSLLALVPTVLAVADETPPTLKLVNNQPFPIQMPVQVRQFPLPSRSWLTGDGQPIQGFGADAVLIATVKASTQKQITLQKGTYDKQAALKVSPAENGLAISYAGKSLG